MKYGIIIELRYSEKWEAISMKYTRVRVIDNGSEETISIFSIDDSNRSYYRNKLYCPEPECTAKLHEYKRNGKIYYQANKNSHIDDCSYRNEVDGTIGRAGEEGVEVPLSERHFQQSIRASYINSNKEKEVDLGNGGKKKIKRIEKDEKGDIKIKLKGVVGREKITGFKEPPILNRNSITDSDIGNPRKITNVKIRAVEEVEGTLKIKFDNKNYDNMYALIGEAYKVENGISNESMQMIKEYIEYHIKNNIDIRFWGGGIINKYENSDLYIMELFFQESFIINGREILGICSWVRNKLR